MSAVTELLERTVQAERDQLGDTLSALGERARAAVDWRSHLRERPLSFVGAALVTGIVTGMVTATRSARPPRVSDHRVPPRASASGESSPWSRLASTLVAIVGTRAIHATDEGIRRLADEYFARRRETRSEP